METQKEESALKTIGEVAEALNLPPHVLRFWETKFPQLKPNKRRGRHRYYRPEDISTIENIRHLLYEQGFTIKGAQKHLRMNGKRQQEITQPDLFAFQPSAAPRTYAPVPKAAETAALAAQQAAPQVADAAAGGLSSGDADRLRALLGEIKDIKQQLRK